MNTHINNVEYRFIAFVLEAFKFIWIIQSKEDKVLTGFAIVLGTFLFGVIFISDWLEKH